MTDTWKSLLAKVPKAEARYRYCIAFTARSGSTWLESLLSKTQGLGLPQEWFNPVAAGRTFQRSGCIDLPAYYSYLKRVMGRRDVFGLEMTWPQARMVLELTDPDFFADMDHWFYLRRRDYVAQGVSLYKAVTSGGFHSTSTGHGPVEVTYDGWQIASFILRLLVTEHGFNAFFEARNLKPRQLCYEELITRTPQEVVGEFADTLCLPPAARQEMRLDDLVSDFDKVGDAVNREMADRFRDEHAPFVAYWDQHREGGIVNRFLKEYPG
ncbi:MAG: Stf0 family sulfotransferase, partial [Halioglobus sp.]